MKKKQFDAIQMVRKIRDKQAEEFWKDPESYVKKLKAAADRLKLHVKKRKRARVS